MRDDSFMAWDRAFARRAERMRASEIRELLKLLDQPEIISFAGGIPDPALFPAEAVREAYDAVLNDPALGPQALQYSVSEGYRPLRSWIAGYMARRGVICDVENIVITSGSQQGLDLLGKLLLSAGDTALVTAPTYLGALQAFNPYEPRYGIINPMDNRSPAAIAREAVGSRIALAYVVPDFANPTGETLDEGARLRLLEMAEALDIPLIEDAAYEALRFGGKPERSCLSLDLERSGNIDRCRTVYCGTFSKTIAPGLRVGWICASRSLVQKVVLAKQAADLHSSTINQIVMHRLAASIFDAQVGKITPVYARRRDAMLAALERHMPPGVTWTRPMGGLFVWLTLPAGLDGADLLEQSLSEERVAFVPGGAFFADGSGKNSLRLNYSLQSEATIEEGVRRLGHLLGRVQGALPRNGG
ncbi:GntR family transcriptional regulator [Hypericibacter adhaerens]|uniref:GntR family transcriptional regulator n=1 Tax=Hypericibacter adhaerens TaxID=2602016 RepID=A0A5J6N1Y5_9PROT|nr:PLP-dependent aminotransferase family protein [Hypericibacter adhaerens]QEX20946.1 GntR family transcriptional regulator [Hypericibacter adhaerens]